MIKIGLTLAVAAASIIGGTVSATAQERRILVGLAAGGSNDLIARELAERLRAQTGDTYIVENKPGAAQRIALGEIRRAAPDGRTIILATNSPFAVLPNVYGDKVGYDPLKDFTPIGRIAKFEMGVAIGPKVNGNSFADFVTWAKANRADASYGTPGAGTGPHFLGVTIGQKIGVPLTHVPYRGGAPAITDLVGGHLPMLINSLPDMLPHHQGGKLKIIGVASAERSPLLKEAQTLKEAGVDFVAETNIDIYGPPGMAPDVVKKLNEQITAAMTSAETRAKLSSYGVVIVTSTPEQLARIAVDELKMWEGPVKASGYQGD